MSNETKLDSRYTPEELQTIEDIDYFIEVGLLNCIDPKGFDLYHRYLQERIELNPKSEQYAKEMADAIILTLQSYAAGYIHNVWSEKTDEFIEFFPGRHIFVSMKDDNSEAPQHHYWNGGQNQLLEQKLEKRNSESDKSGIFFTVNDLDRSLDPEKYRTSKMLHTIRSIFFDDDNRRELGVHRDLSEFPLVPNLIVESSPGKFHYYWLIKDGLSAQTTGLDVDSKEHKNAQKNQDQWDSIQKNIIRLYDGDKNAKDKTRYLRLPGLKHWKNKNKPFTSRWKLVNQNAYEWSQIVEAFDKNNHIPSVAETQSYKHSPNGAHGLSYKERVQEIKAGKVYHDHLLTIAYQRVCDQMKAGGTVYLRKKEIVEELEMLMESVPEYIRANDSDRWESRYSDISRIVDGAEKRWEEESHYEPPIAPERARKNKSLNLIRHLPDDFLLKRIASELELITCIPASTIFMVGLSVCSGMFNRKWYTEFENGTRLNIGLYVHCEQTSGTGKNRILNFYKAPFKNKIIAIVNRINVNKKENESSFEIKSFYTDVTQEALSKQLFHSKGYFSIATAEMAAINTLLGLSYGGQRENNNDLMLNAFDGDSVEPGRASRTAYNGCVAAAITSFAQPSTFRKVFEASHGTGVSERFLVLSEDDAVGRRDHVEIMRIERTRKEIMDKLTSEFVNIASFVDEVFSGELKSLFELSVDGLLKFDDDSYYKIAAYKNKMESQIAEGGRIKHNSIRSTVMKAGSMIMKLACNLCLFDKPLEPSQLHVGGGKTLPLQRCAFDPNKWVEPAINIFNDIIWHMVDICDENELAGEVAEDDAILGYLRRNPNKTREDIKNALKRQSPFKSYIKGSIQPAITEAIRRLEHHKRIGKQRSGDREVYYTR